MKLCFVYKTQKGGIVISFFGEFSID